MSTKDKVADSLSKGNNNKEAAEELGVHRNTVSYHKRSLGAVESDSVQEYRSSQLIELAGLKAQLVNPAIEPAEKIKLALAIIDREMDLLGTKSATKSIQARFSASSDPLYLEFKRSVMGLSEDEVRSALTQLASIPRSQAERNEDWFPKKKETE